MTIIDPPVGPFSAAAEIAAWLDELRAMPDTPERTDAIRDAERWLANAR